MTSLGAPDDTEKRGRDKEQRRIKNTARYQLVSSRNERPCRVILVRVAESPLRGSVGQTDASDYGEYECEYYA